VALLDAGPTAGLSPLAHAWVVLLVAVVAGGPVTVLGMRLLRVGEIQAVINRIERLVDRRKPRRGAGS
jgi:putative peptidoglycan lipid II flippase